MASSFKWVAACSILLLLAPLFSSQTVQSIADNAATGRTGVILLLSKTYSGRDDRANCDVQVNTSHASSGLVTISGADQSTTIDCSGTGLRCFSVTDVSVIIKFVKFVGNRAMFPQPTVPVAPTSHTASAASSDDVLRPTARAATTPTPDESFSQNRDRASFVSNSPASSRDILPTRLSGDLFGMHSFIPLESPAASVRSTSATVGAVQLPVPLAGGCILIQNGSSASIQDSSFSYCASSAVGGSIAIIFVTSVQVVRSTFTDSLVNVVNSSYLSQVVDNRMLRKRLSELTGMVKLPGGIGYGGALFVLPTYALGVSIIIKGCSFLRSQVLAVAGDYDFLFERVNISNMGVFMQGGAFAIFPPVVNKSSASDTGYTISITESSFTQCLVLNNAAAVPMNNFDVVMGGAISVVDMIPRNETDNAPVAIDFYPALSRVILEEVTFSGAFFNLHCMLGFQAIWLFRLSLHLDASR